MDRATFVTHIMFPEVLDSLPLKAVYLIILLLKNPILDTYFATMLSAPL